MSNPDPSNPATGLTILIVDDEKSVRTVAQRMSERLGYRPVVAADCGEALRLASDPATAVQLVLLDVHVGEEDGLQLARSLRELVPAASIIIMGGDLDEQARQTQAKTPRMRLLAKPFAFADLREVLAAASDELRRATFDDGDTCLPGRDSANIGASNGR